MTEVASHAKKNKFRRALAGAAIAGIATAAFTHYALTTPDIRGYGLYHGLIPVTGTIQGHSFPLPAVATRCANCHDADKTNAAGPRPIAALTKTTLTVAAVRRNGPPVAYDEAAFCKVVTEGIDPAMVIIDRTMPRFVLNAADCAALWSYVSQR